MLDNSDMAGSFSGCKCAFDSFWLDLRNAEYIPLRGRLNGKEETPMARRKRQDKISEYHRDEIERQMGLLLTRINAATLTLTPLRPHYDALGQLRHDLRRASNVMRDLDPDYEQTHAAPMSRS